MITAERKRTVGRPKKPGSIADELEIIRKRHGGTLKPEDVVAFARDPKTRLHSRFEWNDGEAAHQWRLFQAREVIRAEVTILPGTDAPVRTYVSLKKDRAPAGPGYRTTASVISDEEMRAQLLEEAKQDAQLFFQKYQKLSELRPIFDAMKHLLG